jgi:hypothetical protein
MPTITLRWGVVLEDATVGQPGETHTVSDGFAAGLIARGRAVLAEPIPKDPAEGPAPVPMSEPVAVVDGKPAQKRRR